MDLPKITDNLPRVAVIGSVNIDYTVYVDNFPAPGETIISYDFRKSSGGKGANSAVAAAHAGADCIFIASVGKDFDGEGIRLKLREHSVITDYMCSSEYITGAAFITVNTQGNNHIVVAAGANLDLDAQYVQDSLESAHTTKPLDAVLISSEIPPSSAVVALEFGATYGIWTIFNPAPVVVELIDFLRHYRHNRFVITPNRGEVLDIAQYVMGNTDSDFMSTVKSLSHNLEICIIATDGENGAIIAGSYMSEHIPSYKVIAIDTVGAGDTFNGYLATAIADGKTLPKAISLATQAGAISTTYHGAWPSS